MMQSIVKSARLRRSSRSVVAAKASPSGCLHSFPPCYTHDALHSIDRPSSPLSFASCDTERVSATQPYQIHNLVQGKWQRTSKAVELMDPLNGEKFMSVPDTSFQEISPFVQSLRACPKSGLHNPLKNPDRYQLYAMICCKAAALLKQPQVESFFARLIQRVSPRSFTQAVGEVSVTQKFLEIFSGDQVRFSARSFAVPGYHPGRWPHGPVAVITPSNFPLEIPALQVLGALSMGNKPILKVDSKVSVVMEQFIRLLHKCEMPVTDMDFINSDGPVMNKLLLEAEPQATLLTGSSEVAEKLAVVGLKGRVMLEDAGFGLKILGPDVQNVDYVSWVCDQDAYACSGQRYSAQSILFMHENWVKQHFTEKLKIMAARRKLDDLTVGPVLMVTTERMLDHIQNLLAIPGARLEFGGKALKNHSIPEVYGAMEPTAVFVPLKEILSNEEKFALATTEILGPLQLLTEYKDEDLRHILEAFERIHAHRTAAAVSEDVLFLQEVLSNTANLTTSYGIQARTTLAYKNHCLRPARDPGGAGIGTPEDIKLRWSHHRKIVRDMGPIPESWKTPQSVDTLETFDTIPDEEALDLLDTVENPNDMPWAS